MFPKSGSRSFFQKLLRVTSSIEKRKKKNASTDPTLEGFSKNCYVSSRALRKEKRTPVQVNILNPRSYSYSECFQSPDLEGVTSEFIQKTCVWVYEFKRTDPYQPGKLFHLPTAKLKPLCINPKMILGSLLQPSFIGVRTSPSDQLLPGEWWYILWTSISYPHRSSMINIWT